MDRNLGQLLVAIYQDIVVCRGQVRSYAQLFLHGNGQVEKSPTIEARIDDSTKAREVVFSPQQSTMVRISAIQAQNRSAPAMIDHHDRYDGVFQISADCEW